MSCAKRSLRIESLEQKQLLAGDVVVNVVNGVLTLEGDELGNQVVVSSGEDPGSFVIRGLDGTQLVEGDAEPVTELVVESVRHGLRANLGEGDDVLRVENATIRGNVAINTGAGDDRVVMGIPPATTDETLVAVEEAVDDANVKLGQNLIINTGEGNDTVAIDDTVARGALHVSAGAGDDIVRLGRPDETPAEDGDDAEPERPDVSFGRGVHVGLGEGDDSLVANDLRAGGLGLHVNGGAGADTIRIVGVHSPVIDIIGGRGDDADEVSIQDSATRLLFVALGGGDDTLSLGGVNAQLALLSGGLGEADTLTLLGENMIRHRRVAGFEIRNPSEETAPVA
jgi:hypothetical protein